ncbi:Kelch-like protein 20 like protein [Argiope bruennichi]|uniref:Kelch-like protein diablo n=1 Tax=Argiope bruennichi TaxID=94029 RepID=A0A8T0EPY1_ARGBR|nr:Kelch-like protein 20 like protein [Argiope bruennichi]
MNLSAKSFEDIFNSGIWEGQQQFADGTLQTFDGATFKIHRVILSLRSGFFRALFSFNLNQETIDIPSIDSRTLESILLYIYTSAITLDEKNVWDLMIASDYLLLDDLLKNCQSFAIQNMTSKNCLSSLSIAWHNDRLGISGDFYRYALVHFEDILKAEDGGFEALPFEILKKLLKSNNLNAISEKSVWKVIVSWIEANSFSRLPHVPALLLCLKLDEEVDEELAAEILSHVIVSNNPHCSDLMLSKQFNYYLSSCKLLSEHARSEPISCQNSPNSYAPRMPKRLYIIARHTLTSTKCGSELFLTYDNELDFGRQIGETDFFIDTIVQIGQFIYMFNEWTKINLIFDIAEEAWLPVSISRGSRHDSYIITLGEHLFSVGGTKSGDGWTKFIFRYDFVENRWRPITMPHRVVIYGTVPLKGKIYIVGMGEFEPTPILMCQVYDPERNEWNLFPPPNICRQEFSTVAFHEQVFLIAGEKDGHYLKTVEVYDPLQNTWMCLPDLPFSYFYPKAVTVDDKIIVYENINDDTRFYKVSPPVYWDENTRMWRIINESSPLFCIERYTFLVLDDCRLVKDLTAKNRRPGIKWDRIFPL